MTTQTVGIKEFRANPKKYMLAARRGKKRYVLTDRNRPMVELTPVKESIYTDEFIRDMDIALKEIHEGKTISLEELVKELGLEKQVYG